MRAIAEEIGRQANENIRAGIKKESAITTACTIFETVFGSYMDKTNPQYPYPPEIRQQFITMGKELIVSAVEREETAIRVREEAQRAAELQQQQQAATAHQHPVSPFGGLGRTPIVPPPPAQVDYRSQPAAKPTSDQPSAAPGGSTRGSMTYPTLQPPQPPPSALPFGSAPPSHSVPPITTAAGNIWA